MSRKIIPVTKLQLRNFLIAKHFASNAKASSFTELLNLLSCVQVDPIDVSIRNHELIVYNRLQQPVSRAAIYTEAYQGRSTFEYWLQLYSYIPITSYPYLSAARQRHTQWRKDYYQEHREQLSKVIKYITDHGPTSSKQLQEYKTAKPLFSFYSANSATGLLSYLWDTGELGIAYRDKNFKFYDLNSRLLPAAILNHKVTNLQSRKFIVKTFFQYLGVIRSASLSRAGSKLKLGEILQQWWHQGRVVKLKITDIKSADYYILKEDLPKLLSAERLTSETPLILAPLDPLILDRTLLEQVFDFHYRWEVYTPPNKRKFGYYNMPVLLGNELIGQIELRRNKSGMQILNLDTKLDHSSSFNKLLHQEIDKIYQYTI